MSEYVHLCLSDLLDEDLSSYEYFNALPEEIQTKIRKEDFRTFEEMQNYVQQLRQ